jgi:hypothetical protein
MNCDLPTPTKNFNKTCDISFPGADRLTFNVSLDIKNSPTEAKFWLPHKFIWEPVSLEGAWNSYVNSHAEVGPYVHVLNLPNLTLAGVKNSISTFAYAELGFRYEEIRRDTSISDYIYVKNLTGCSLSMCLKDYQISVQNGISSIKGQDLGFGTIFLKYPGMAIPTGELEKNPLCWRPGLPNITRLPEAEGFTFCHSDMYYLKDRIEEFLPSMEGSSWSFTPEFYQQRWGGGSDSGGMDRIRTDRLERIGFERSLANVAASLTKFGLDRTDHSVLGTARVTQAFVRVRWLWMILPAILVVAGTIFFTMTILATQKNHIPLWKSSALASYFHGVERIDDDDQYLTASSMEKKSENTDVRLEASENKGRLMLVPQDDYNPPGP